MKVVPLMGVSYHLHTEYLFVPESPSCALQFFTKLRPKLEVPAGPSKRDTAYHEVRYAVSLPETRRISPQGA